jgi:phospholipase C
MMQRKLVLLCACAICLAGALIGCGGGSSSVSRSGGWGITLSQSGSFAPGGTTGQYAIAVTNNTSAATSGTIMVTDTLPSVFTANGTFGSGWTCTASSGSVACTSAGPIAAGANSTITINVNVAAGASGTYPNQATVSGGGPASATQSIQTQIGVGGGGKIEHVVIIVQENRTTDNLFQGLCTANGGVPGCGTGQNQYNIQNYGYVGATKVSLTPIAQGMVTCNKQGENCYDLGHGHSGFLNDCDWNGTACAMDGWNANQCDPGAYCPANPQMQYVPGSADQLYIQLAQTYAFGDNMFQTNQGPSFPAHQYLFGGSSAVCAPGGSCPAGFSSTDYVSGNPTNNDRADGTPGVGCLAPPDSEVKVIDTSQPFPNGNEFQWGGQECMDRPTLADLLNSAGLTWRYYAAQDGSIWTAPDAIQEICTPTTGPLNQLACNGSQWNSNVVLEGSGAQIITDIQAGNLANVTWVIPTGPNSDHAGNSIDNGPSWVDNIVNAVGQSPFWPNTAIIVTWDDWGGWFDHVAPPIRNNPDSYPNSYEYGYRVPIIVISPFGKQNYVSHQQNDFGSILLFIEEQFLAPGTYINGGGYADSYALGDLSDFFDFSQGTAKFQPIKPDVGPEVFINSKEKPTPPDND